MYVKLFGSILDSSIWSEDHATRLVWITMLAMADEAGTVHAALPGLAKRAGVTRDECDHAIRILSSPDKESRSEEAEGRRIEKVDGGWALINYEKYRQIRTREQLQAARRMRRYRDRQRNSDESDAIKRDTPVTGAKVTPQVEVEVEGEKTETTTLVGRSPDVAVGMSLVRHKAKGYPEVVDRIASIFAEVSQHGKRTMKADETREMQAEIIFAYWAARLGHEQAMLDSKRTQKLKQRLEENGGNVHELLFVVDGAKRDDHLMGRNGSARKYDGIETLFRDRGQVERLAELGGYKPGISHKMAEKYQALVAV